jgi:hypothetical protein
VIKLRTNTAAIRLATLLVAAATLNACGQDNGVDYCKNHYAYHSDHLDSLATLTIKLSDVGALDGKLSIPITDVEAILADPNKTFSLQTEVPCEVTVEGISPTSEGVDVEFVANCGPDNKIGQIDVALFDHVAALEEVVVSITTSATNKRFGISRQCDSPIFRLD